MATVHSSRTCLPKLCCSITAIGLFIAGILITGAYPHSNIDDHDFNAATNKTNLTSTGNFTLAAERLALIQASNKALYNHLDEALDRINKNVQQNKELADQISRSPRAVRTIQALEAAIAMFERNQPEPEYQTSEYATGNRHWRRAPKVHPIKITELLNHEVQKEHNRNEILGDKVAQILKQNTDLSDKLAEEYQTPSEKLKKYSIMALVTKTISTYMLKTRMARSPGSSASTKEETTTEWFIRTLANSPFPIQTIRTLGKALNILTNTTPED
jgi:hypothetical protein